MLVQILSYFFIWYLYNVAIITALSFLISYNHLNIILGIVMIGEPVLLL